MSQFFIRFFSVFFVWLSCFSSEASSFDQNFMEPRDEKWARVSKIRGAKLGVRPGRPIVLGDSQAARWPAALQIAQFGTDFVNLGVGNDRIENILWRVNQYDIQKANAPFIFVLMGTNNFKTTDQPEIIVEKILAGLDVIQQKSPNSDILISEIFPWCGDIERNNNIKKANDMLNLFLRDKPYTLVRSYEKLYSSCETDPKELYHDKIHLNEDGYEFLGKSLQLALEIESIGQPRN